MLIDSNPEDAVNILGILVSINKKFKTFHSNTTEEALEYLKKDKMLPHLILLGSTNQDYNRIEFLKNINTDNNLKKIPVVIISSSNEHNHVTECFQFGAAGYMVKNGDTSELIGTINTIMQYWNTCEIPQRL
jgi:DNA-binding NarL/FixJ family response regulator